MSGDVFGTEGFIMVVQHLLVWESVTPITAVTYFEPRYHNDPLILQYAHRVLEQHPVDLTFFFVPQVVQALRNDPSGIYPTLFYYFYSNFAVSRLRTAFYFGDGANIAVVLSSDHLEHES